MERTERLFAALGDVDEALIAAAAPQAISKPTKAHSVRKWLVSAACLCFAVLAGIAVWGNPAVTESMDDIKMESTELTNGYPPAEIVAAEGSSAAGSSTLEGGLVIRATTAQLYDSFEANGLTYSVFASNKKISEIFLDGELGKSVADFGPNSDRTLGLTYYRILGISEECAVAVVFEGESDIYVYRNVDYQPASMAQLFADMHLSEYLTLDTVTHLRVEGDYLHRTVYSINTEQVMTKLLADMMEQAPVSIRSYGTITPASLPNTIEISGDMAMFGDSDLEFCITHNGYLILSLLGRNYIFEIGEEAVAAYLKAVEQDATDIQYESEIVPRAAFSSYSYPTLVSVYDSLTVHGIAYRCESTGYGMDAARVGEKLGEFRAAETMYAPTVSYYRIHGVSVDCGIAVRFPNSEVYYAYYASDYRPETLGDLIEDMGLRSYLHAGAPTVTYREGSITQTVTFSEHDTAMLWEYLLVNTQAKNVTTDEGWGPREETIRIEIPLMLPLFTGAAETTLWITEDGMLRMELLDRYYVFPIVLDEIRQAEYIFQLIWRGSDFELKTEDSVPRPSGKWTWKKAAMNERYTSFESDIFSYTTAFQEVDALQVGEQLGTALAVGYDPQTDMMHHAPVTYYAVGEENSARTVAVRFSEEKRERYYLYENHSTLPDTMGQFFLMNDWYASLKIFSCSFFVDGTRRRSAEVQFPDVDVALLERELFSEEDAPNIYKSDGITSGGGSIFIEAELTRSDGSVVPVWIYVRPHGYLTVYIDTNMNHPYCFDIGTAHTDAVARHILNDCLDNIAVVNGTMVRQSGETTQDAIARQIREAFGMENATP